MKYYKPTNFFQKVWKIIRLYALFEIARWRRPRSVKPQGTFVLSIVSELDRIGGLELQALEVSRALAELNNFVVMLTDVAGDLPEKEFRSGFVIYRLPFRSRPGKFQLLIGTLLFFIRRARSYEILHVHGVTGFTLLALRISKWMKRPSVLIAQTKDDFANIFSRHDFKHRIYQRWLQHVDRYIAISAELAEEMKSCGIDESRIHRIPNFVNSAKFQPPSTEQRAMLRSKFSVEGSQIVFLFLGRLIERKGADVLLNAWKLQSPGILWIAGDGPEEVKLRKLTRELDLKNVVFFGKTGQPHEFYQAADVFVLPSKKEGLPCTILEAMSCGLPSIATAIGGIVEEIENEKDGLLIPPDSAEALAQAIRRMASEHNNRTEWSNRSLEKARLQYDVSAAAAKYHSLYAELAQGTR